MSIWKPHLIDVVKFLFLLQLWSAYVPCGAQHLDAVQLTLEQIDVIRRLSEKYYHALEFVTSADGKYKILLWRDFST